MNVIKMQVGHLATNCYIVYCNKTLKAVIVDPGGEADSILSTVNKYNLDITYIINTHGHADHIGANDKIKEATKAKVLIHEADANMLVNAQGNLSAYLGENLNLERADRLLKDGDKIGFGEIELTVIHTPGHSPGSICLCGEKVLFSGDTLFAESVGRTDFPGGSYSKLINSIKNKLLCLDDSVKVLPGHGPDSTIGWERRMNPFIQ